MWSVLSLIFDLLLIGMLIPGIAVAFRLSKQIRELKATRSEMEKIILSFNTTVLRAETSVRDLKIAARTNGDDLEKLIDRASGLKDELIFISDSADKIASRLTDAAAATISKSAVEDPSSLTPDNENKPLNAATVARIKEVLLLAEGGRKKSAQKETALDQAATTQLETNNHATASSAERELLRALEKMRS